MNRDDARRAAPVRPGPHERYALRLAWTFMRESAAAAEDGREQESRDYFQAMLTQHDIAANEARRMDRSDTALVMRLRRMVQP